MILAGDVGGTKTNVALFEPAGERPRKLAEASYASGEHDGLEPIVGAFLAGPGRRGRGVVEAACFGVAGPVAGRTVQTTNLPWEIDADRLERDLGLPRAVLVNDLVATAESLPALAADELAVLQEGEPDPTGNRALIAAGTGLGMALLPWVGDGWAVVASEGGHGDFPARNEAEARLRRFLAERHGHVSLERVVSGPGLLAIYEELVASRGEEGEAEIRAALAAADDPPGVIGEAGLAGRSRLSAEALERFVAVYGAAAGNLALTALATGGVFLGGGIAPKVLPALASGGFLEAFRAKGRFRELLTAMPVWVILEPGAALLGAARRAAQELSAGPTGPGGG